ncbi:MAG TPA: NTP transferase domain-containing protein, partial [Bacteroidia bacterium]|nr:NTP transferase domain-containing protein [Bacteroidia bacterium]
MHQNTPLYGLVLAGGESRRMGSAKAALEYHGLPESDRMVDLLRRSCTSVYVGCREDQLSSLPEHQLPISDLPRFAGNGPIGSL